MSMTTPPPGEPPEEVDPSEQIDTIEQQLRDLATHFEQQAAPPDEPPEPDTEPDLTGEAAPSEGDPTPPQPERVSLLGHDLRPDEVESLVGFYDWVRAHPEQALAIDAFMRGQAEFVVPQQAPATPATPEPTDDELEQLPEPVRQKLAEIDELRQQVGMVQTDSMARRHAEAQAVVGAAGQNFAQKYGLEAQEVEELQREAAALNVIPGFIAQGAQWGQAVEEALDVAYWRNPKYREAHAERLASQAKQDQQRQRKAGSLSGGSGSAPRTAPPVADTPEARRAGMIQMIAAAQNGNGQ